MPRRQRHLNMPRRSGVTAGSVAPGTRLMMALEHHLLDLRDGLRGIEILRTGLGAVHDRVAAIQPEGILEIVETFAERFVTRVDDPAIGREQRRGPEIALAVPPVARAGRGAACTQDARRGAI